MNKNSDLNQKNNSEQKQNTIFVVFKYVAIGSGIIGIGFLIAFLGLLLSGS